LFSLLFLMAVMGVRFAGPDLVRFGLLLATITVYLAFWFFLSLLCSIVARRSSVALLAAVLCWIGLAFVVPYGATEAGKRVVKVMGLADFYKERKQIESQERKKRFRRIEELGRTKPADYPFQQWRAYYDYFMGIFRLTNQVEQGMRHDVEQQMHSGIRWSRLSPAALYLNITSNLAGTGFHDYWQTEDFKENLYLTYKDSFEKMNVEQVAKSYQQPHGGADGAAAPREKFDRSRLPSREYAALGTGTALRNSLTDILLLVLESVVLFITGFRLFIREGAV
jgi:hypothetical protein